MVDVGLDSPEITHGRAASPYIRTYAGKESEIEQHDGESSNSYMETFFNKKLVLLNFHNLIKQKMNLD